MADKYFINRHKGIALGIMGLLVILLITRLYYLQRRRRRRKLGLDDMALLQIIRDHREIGYAFHEASNADRILGNLKRDKKLVRLKERIYVFPVGKGVAEGSVGSCQRTVVRN